MNTCAHCGGFELARRKPPAQPRSVFGSPEDIIEHGTDVLARQTERLGISIAKAVHGLTSARQINAAIKRAGREWPVRRMALPLQGELLHGAMLGALDSDFESRTNRPVAVPSFSALHADPFLLAGYDRSKDPAFATRPVGEARKRFEQREAVTRPVYDAMTDAARRRAVTVAGAATADIVRTVQRELVRQVADGASLADFSNRVVPRLEQAGWTPVNDSHAENVLRTNIGTAYNAGRAHQMTQPTVLRFRPFWQIITVNDGPPRQRPTHQAAHLVVLRADDPFWLRAYPPFGYQCRCRVRNLSQREGEPLAVLGSTIQGLPDRGFTSGLPSLDLPPPVLPPANDTIPPPANDTIPPAPEPERPSLPARQRPLETFESFSAHLASRGANPDLISQGAYRKAQEIIGRDLTPDELDSLIGHEAFADLPGKHEVTVDATWENVQFITEVNGGADVRLVRTFRRDEGKLAVHHDLLRLNDRLQGEGIGPRVIKKQLETYEAIGVDQIDLDAAWVGRYYWPKLGFDVPPAELKVYRDQFEEYLRKRGAPPQAVRKLTEGIKSMRDIATTRVGTKELGKDFFLGDVIDPNQLGPDGQPIRGQGHAGGLIERLAIKVRPGEPIYEQMKVEVSKPPRRSRKQATPSAPRTATELARRKRRRGKVERGLHDPQGQGLADDLIGNDSEPRDGWRRFDDVDWTEDDAAKRGD